MPDSIRTLFPPTPPVARLASAAMVFFWTRLHESIAVSR
jgi:hypothetical protein